MGFDPSIVSQIGRFLVHVLLRRSVRSPFVGFLSVMDKSFVRHSCPLHPTRVDSSEALDDSTRFARSRSASPEVKTREIMIHKRFSFLKRDYKLESIRVRYLTIRLDSNGVDQPRFQGLSSYRPLRSLRGGGKMRDPRNEVGSRSAPPEVDTREIMINERLSF